MGLNTKKNIVIIVNFFLVRFSSTRVMRIALGSLDLGTTHGRSFLWCFFPVPKISRNCVGKGLGVGLMHEEQEREIMVVLWFVFVCQQCGCPSSL